MNNKGQTLVFFVILIPLLFTIFAFIFDYSAIVRERNRLTDLGQSSMHYLLEKNISQEKVLNNIKANDNTIDVKFKNSNEIYLTKNIKSVFGNIIGFKKYEIKVSLQGTMSNNKLIIEEKRD